MIFYHTGTGNSWLVAQRLAGMLGDRIIRIDFNTPRIIKLNPSERVIWVFPVYSWGIPPKVKDFIRSVNLLADDNVPHFMVCTCGDDIGLTAKQWRDEMSRRGWTSMSACSVQMPNNYVSLPGFDVDPQALVEKKLEAVVERLTEMVNVINSMTVMDSVVTGSMPWIKSRILYPLFCRFLMSPKAFKCTSECVGCGKCSRVCPRENISLNENRRPEWGGDCAMCLACYHVCPQHAVAYGRYTLKKGQYFAPQELPQERSPLT